MTSISLSQSGPPDTILDPEPPQAQKQLAEAQKLQGDELNTALGEILSRWPKFLEGWATLGELAQQDAQYLQNIHSTMLAYAAFRVGYHRGLDRLRQNGWRGSGMVRWEHPENRGFLRSLEGLRKTAEQIGEMEEAERCAMFLRQLDPGWDSTRMNQ